MITENMSQFVPMIATFIGMTAVSCIILYNDFKHLKVRLWQLLLFVLIGFIGVYVGRISYGKFNPIILLSIPIYMLLNALNSMFNHNKLIGQADVDVLSGSIALFIPVSLIIITTDFGEYSSSIKSIYIGGIAMDLLTWMLIGFILSILAALIKFVVIKIKEKNSFQPVDATIVIPMAQIKAQNAVSDIKEDVKDLYSSFSDDEKMKERQEKYKLRGTKIPVCLAFIPMFYYMVYMAIYLKV